MMLCNPSRRFGFPRSLARSRWAIFLALLLCCNAQARTSVEFPAGAQSIEVPFSLASEHIYVDVEINGKGPFHFIFDTGAVNILTPWTAKQLSLAVDGKVEANGTGGVQDAGETKVESTSIAGVTLHDQRFYIVDLPSADTVGKRVDGLIGYGWLSEIPTRIDYAASKLTFHQTKEFRYQGPARATPLFFRGTRPQIDASVDGITGRFTVDTGSSGSLILFPGFVDKNDLAAKYHAKTEIISAVGVGGPVYSLLARAKSLQLGGTTIDNPVTYLSRARTGAAADGKTAGSVGFGVLRRFNITFDYANAKAYFEANAAVSEPDLADRSGLRIDAVPGGFKVVFVAKDSPGMRAGLSAGDVILSVDGKPAEEIGLLKFRASLKGAIGTKIALGLTGDKKPATVELDDL